MKTAIQVQPVSTLADLRTDHPIFAATPSDRMSERYKLINTRDTIQHVLDGPGSWSIIKAWSRKSRKKDPTKALHGAILRSSEYSFQDPRSPEHPMFLQASILNSHDGSSGKRMFAGLFALLCSNGLVFSTGSIFEARYKHFDTRAHKVDGTEGATFFDEIIRHFATMQDSVNEMSGIKLSDDDRMSFARECAMLRYDDEATVTQDFARTLLTPVRTQDANNAESVWNTFNIVQEKLSGGWSPDLLGVRKQRPIADMNRYNDLNIGIWNAAKKFLPSTPPIALS